MKIDIDASSNNDSDFDPTINKKKDSTVQDLDANITSSIKPRSKASVESEEKQVVKKVLQKEQLRTNINRDIRNAVAPSILEGVFTWSGEEWCLNKNKADDTNNLMEQKDAIQSKTKIKTIKKKEIPTERKPQPPRLCDLCGDVFNEDHKLIAHKKRVHFNNPIKCPVCPMTCSSEYYLNCHMERRHRNNKIYECKFCDSKFAFIKDIHKHVEYVHEKKRKGNKIFACDTCDKTYKCVQSLTIHKRSVHTGERPDICTVCGARFFHIIYLREHMRLHTGETPYKCPICNRGYAQRGNMTSHLRNHRKSELDAATLKNDSSSNYDSDFDPAINIKEESPDLKDLDEKTSITTKVKATSTQSKEKNVVKKVLPKKQNNGNKRNTEASSILEGEFSWSGEQWCLNKKAAQNTIQKTKKKLQQVKKKNTPKEKKPPPPKLCDLCGEVFEQDKLVAHVKRVHLNSPAKCPVCSRICSSEYYLNRHMKRKHLDDKKYQCKSCDKTFAFVGELRSHTRYVHEKIRRTPQIFPCDMCERTFKCMQSLTIHKRSVHTGERPEKCSVCGAGFYHIVYLREHMRLHTGETPYKCPICDRGYAQRGNMRSHLRIHRKSELDAATLSKIKPRLLRFLKA
ncbi:Zinc finger protein 252 [Papilio xuthus]|uniref:Zinc finger protein 252 n=1 Tax=Papilio xuthus TaxID=66420 RepID=A0A194PHD5_PAPXU|nr:Zinc finger protein 252 [Papilio xuthus]